MADSPNKGHRARLRKRLRRGREGAQPSPQDIRLTRELSEAARHMKIAVHDLVIVAGGGRTSLRAEGLI